ncbi:MAG: hypothetical protein JXA62_09780 [Candidatus Aminicenantes bacterium]|nr:hypothetical protein [Candidatus Aminicenantes bacterium]
MWLSKRHAAILDHLLHLYARTHHPVSSRDLSARLPFSDSTVRKELQWLESRGYVTKSSASSGRIPTNLAIKYCLRQALHDLDDQLDPAPPPVMRHQDFQGLSDDCLFQLSQDTSYVGFFLLRSIFDLRFRRIRLVKVGNHRVMAVVQSMHGWSVSRLFSTRENHSDVSLREWQDLMNREFAGKSLQAAFRSIRNRLFRDKAQFLRIYRELYYLLSNEDFMGAELFVKGTQNILDSTLVDPRKIKGLLQALEEKARLARFLNDIQQSAASEPSILFGSETGISDLEDFLLIFSNVIYQQRPIGNMGVIGPKFTAGRDTLSRVNLYSRHFSRILSRRSVEV